MPEKLFSLSSTLSCNDCRQRITMFTFTVLCFLSLWASQIRAQTYDVFKITAPKSGDTVTIGKYTTEGVTVPIEWTVLDELADRPVLISLVQGDNVSSLETIAQINCACFVAAPQAALRRGT
jgi:hypothetical protein